MAQIIVTGGAGYIGSHMLLALENSGHSVTVVDNLSRGFRDAVNGAELAEIDLRDFDALDALFAVKKPDIVLHFADFINVSESVGNPSRYYRNNIGGTATLLEVMQKYDVRRMVHSSSASVYGETDKMPIAENAQVAPINPYGKAKMIVEMMLEDAEHAYGLQHISLRYFNVAGADPQGRAREQHEPETHLIPNVLRAVAGKQKAITVFGTDYPTPDGTCVRDYIHVCDLADAHALAMTHLLNGGKSGVFNIGYGHGYSVQEIINAVEKATGKPVPVEYGPRRAGDPAILVADASRIRAELGWQPKRDDIDLIISSAYNAEKSF